MSSVSIVNLTGALVRMLREDPRGRINGREGMMRKKFDGAGAFPSKEGVRVAPIWTGTPNILRVKYHAGEVLLPVVNRHWELHGLPDPKEGTMYLVDQEVVEAARAVGRTTDDLLVPSHKIMDFHEVLGYLELTRY